MQTLFDGERGEMGTTGHEESDKRQRKCVPRTYYLKCAVWLADNWALLATEKFPSETICERMGAAAECPMKISLDMLKSLLKGMGKDGTEIGLPAKRAKRSASTPQLKSGNAVRHVAAQLALTQQVLASLCEQLGHTNPLLSKLLPDWLRQFASGKATLKTVPQSIEPGNP